MWLILTLFPSNTCTGERSCAKLFQVFIKWVEIFNIELHNIIRELYSKTYSVWIVREEILLPPVITEMKLSEILERVLLISRHGSFHQEKLLPPCIKNSEKGSNHEWGEKWKGSPHAVKSVLKAQGKGQEKFGKERLDSSVEFLKYEKKEFH